MKQFTLLLIVAALIMTCGAWQPAHAQTITQEGAIITDIAVRGYANVPPATQDVVRQSMKSTIGEPLNATTVREDVERILATGWFFRVVPTVESTDGGVLLIITVTENMVISGLDFIGNISLTDEELACVLTTQPGTVLNFSNIYADAQAIRTAYAQRGYTAIEVTAVNPTEDGRLEFVIFEPTIGEIRVEGNSKTRDYVILRELTFAPGDVFNERTIRESLLNLRRLGIFEEVTAVPEPGTTPGTFAIAIRVTERRTGLASVGVGHSNINGLIGFVDVADTNLFGTGQRLNARVQFGADNTYQLTYTNPWFAPNRTSFTASIYDRTTLRQIVLDDEASKTYDEHRRGGFVSFGRPIARNTRAALTLRADKVEASDFQEIIDENPDLDQEEFDPQDIRSTAVTLTHDTRVDPIYPTAGVFSSLTGEYAGFGGTREYTKVQGEGRYYTVVRRRPVRPGQEGQPPLHWVYATRVMAGTFGGNPPYLDLFQVGGANTLRGYEEDAFVGRNMVVWNNELRVPFNTSLQGVAFVDIGDAWGGEFARISGNEDFKLNYGYGLGVRVQTPIGPLRLDYGWGEDGNSQFNFGFGSTF